MDPFETVEKQNKSQERIREQIIVSEPPVSDTESKPVTPILGPPLQDSNANVEAEEVEPGREKLEKMIPDLNLSGRMHPKS